ncbi:MULTISPECIES: hypothetical protein [Streptomyces]|uniref:hypothetical protein n=1 Tax=Streptomyces TaxID=1883 RepID=UPI0013B40942|nr:MULTISPECIES: hypothetical protein [Streptomyces]
MAGPPRRRGPPRPARPRRTRHPARADPPAGPDGGDTVDFWPELLQGAGATGGLFLDTAAEDERSPDGTTGRLERLCAARRSGWGPRAGLGLALRGISGSVHRDWVGRGAHGVSGHRR